MSNARNSLIAFYLNVDTIFCDPFREVVKWLSERYSDGTFEMSYDDSIVFKTEFERNGKRYFIKAEVVDQGYDDLIDINIERAVYLNGRATVSLDKKYLIGREDNSSEGLIHSLELFDKNLELKFVHQELEKNPGIIQAGV